MKEVINIKNLWSASAVNGCVEIVGTRSARDNKNFTVVKIPMQEYLAIYRKIRREAVRQKESADARILAFERAEG